jgi:hypothetical protein
LVKVFASTILGSDGFIEEVRDKWFSKKGVNRDVPALKQLSKAPDLGVILKETVKVLGREDWNSRRLALYLSHELSGKRLEEIGKFYGGIGPSAITQNTRRVKTLLESDKMLLGEVEKLKKLLSE